MKKKTLAVLLVIPFVVSLLTFVSVKILNDQVAVDIKDIKWKYRKNEGFKVDDTGYKLEAEPVIDETKILSPGNDLLFTIPEVDFARIERGTDGSFTLFALKEGNCDITCSNEKKTVSKSFNATFFENGAMIINLQGKASHSNIDDHLYYGLYDLKDGKKKTSSLKVDTLTFLEDGTTSPLNSFVECSSNVTYQDDTIYFKEAGKAYIQLEYPNSIYNNRYEFTIIDGVNIYSYSDLIECTNRSIDKCNIVMQTSLDSIKDVYKRDDKGLYIKEKIDDEKELFGNFDFTKQRFSFEDEIYTFDTTYDTTFIDYYNDVTGKSISKRVKTGIRLNGDMYGNGFAINMNDLCYPNNGTVNIDGKLTPDRNLDYFYGPLSSVSIGDPENMPLVSALGQDNSGIYVCKDNTLIDDIKIKNSDDVDNMYNLTYTGSNIDVFAKDVTLKNSVISNGKVNIRAYDSNDLSIDNCILKNAAEFNMMVGSNKKKGYDFNKNIEGKDLDTFMKSDANDYYDSFVQASVDGSLSSNDYFTMLNKVQDALDDKDVGEPVVEMNVNDTMFNSAGVFAIAFESAFNGVLLYDKIPSMIANLLSDTLNCVMPYRCGGTSYPVKLSITGDSRFYSWKEIDKIDVSSLIEQNITFMLNQLGMGDKKVTLDEIFPMKKALLKQASSKGLVYRRDGKDYINASVAFYGGGLNSSVVDIKTDGSYNTYCEEFEADLLKELIQNSTAGARALLVDAVISTIGSRPFRFITNSNSEVNKPILIDESPKIEDLMARNR